MLGLVSYSNVMDTLLYPPPHTLGLRLPISRRSYNENSPVSPEPDPILEDTPDLLDEQDVDYSVVPPDVGLNVLLNEIGCEVPATDTPSKYGKRALCSFSSNISSTDEDLDDYPFHAVTYGENSSCFGLPYNDHNYASVEMLCKTNRSNVVGNTVSSNAEHEDRLTLLAKLALAKDGKQCSEPSVYSHKFPELNRFQHKPPSNLIPAASSDISQLSSRVLTAESAADAFATSDGLHSSPASAFGADNHTLSSGSARALVLPVSTAVCTVASSLTGSINALPSALPLQVHRVTSSLKPHVLLRTSLPALQINTTVSRAPYSVDSSGAIRCVCGYTHTDGCVVQCEKCW
ncbi:Histone-lysine N-methyltransferase 2E [Fasciola hepatica]|uniref:Histone-lysine N-methyltransferase 2E n=1 Tax=Fasciola hepatica TaxID=6192 RepID=A0A4E0RSU8_FASHE|nr:Histone-lysine N-methyltransferase 2E [Fasciola hepatica]